jgi:hypothetical protein
MLDKRTLRLLRRPLYLCLLGAIFLFACSRRPRADTDAVHSSDVRVLRIARSKPLTALAAGSAW